MPGCILLPYDTAAGFCAACGDTLTGRKKRWCGNGCEEMFWRNHYWNTARAAALTRDGFRCTKCNWESLRCTSLANGQKFFWAKGRLLVVPDADNWLEVNHITPRLGQGYGTGCWHHQANLETLCHLCHVKVTRQQRIARSRGRYSRAS